jgi:TolB protein
MPVSSPTLVQKVTSTISTSAQISQWNIYTDTQFKVTVSYPANWQKDNTGDAMYKSTDGFFQLSAVASEAPTAAEVCAGSIDGNRKDYQYGTSPSLQYLVVDGESACLIWPSADQSPYSRGVSLLAVQFPKILAPQPYILLLFADKDHIWQMAKRLKFDR